MDQNFKYQVCLCREDELYKLIYIRIVVCIEYIILNQFIRFNLKQTKKEAGIAYFHALLYSSIVITSCLKALAKSLTPNSWIEVVPVEPQTNPSARLAQ